MDTEARPAAAHGGANELVGRVEVRCDDDHLGVTRPPEEPLERSVDPGACARGDDDAGSALFHRAPRESQVTFASS
jgi:hypothetical protein